MEVLESRPSNNDSAGISVYSDYVGEQLAREDARQESLERRALAVITSAGAISTLLFGLAAFNIDKKHFTLPASAKLSLSFALAFFLLSALLAIAVNFPTKTDEVDPEELTDILKGRWKDSQFEAERMTTLTRLKVFVSARSQNNKKARFLYAAVIAQGLAVAAVAATVWIIL